MNQHSDLTDPGDISGMTIGQYQIIRKLGQGGMASVYLAQQANIKREVAVKVMPPNFTHEEMFMQRFEREVQVIADLQHPRVLPVFDYGQFQGRPYIVMAYMSGGTLADRIRSGSVSLPETVRLIGQIAEGLDHAHAKGVIHRDFKPSNILLDENGNAYLADFGIAKISEATIQLTGGGIVGTPAYMAPEMSYQAESTKLVDIYAMGVTIFELLTGEFPFEGETPFQVMMAHTSRPVPNIRLKRPDLPEAVAAVITRAMAKSPDDRYQTAGELANDLRNAAIQPGDPEAPVVDYETSVSIPASAELPTAPAMTTPAEQAEAPTQRQETPSVPVQAAAPAAQEKKGCRWGLWAAIGAAGLGAIGVCIVFFALLLPLLTKDNNQNETPVAGITNTPQVDPEATPTQKPQANTGSSATLTVNNESSASICELYVSFNDLDSWGDDLLAGGQGIVEPGESYLVSDLHKGKYDYMAVACDGLVLDEHYAVDLQGANWDWTIRDKDRQLSVVNSSSYTVCALYVSAPEDGVWAVDFLGENVDLLPGEQTVVPVANGVWDMRAETCDELTFWEEYEVYTGDGFQFVVDDLSAQFDSGAGNTSLVIHNDSSSEVCYIYITPEDSDSWGEDQLGGSDTIPPGTFYTLHDIPPGIYDYYATDCDDYLLSEHYGVEFSDDTWDWFILDMDTPLTVYNNSSYEICTLYIASPFDTSWGFNRLEDTGSLVPGDDVLFYIEDVEWDFYAETCDGQFGWEQYSTFISGGYTWTLVDGDRFTP